MSKPQQKVAIVTGEPRGGWSHPNAVLFLVRDEARHITGLAMTVDGGCSSAM